MISECFSRNCVSLSWKTALKWDGKWSALATLLYALKSLHRPVGHCGIIFYFFLRDMFVLAWTTQQVPHVEKDLLTLLKHLRSLKFFSIGFHIAQSWVFYVVLCVMLFVCLTFFIFGNCIFSSLLNNDFLCPLVVYFASLWAIYKINNKRCDNRSLTFKPWQMTTKTSYIIITTKMILQGLDQNKEVFIVGKILFSFTS